MNKRFLTVAILSAAAIGAACHSLGTESDQAEAKSLWDQMSGYKSWPQFEGFEGVQPGDSVHGDFVQVFMNSVAAADSANPGFGSIIVKEGYDDEAAEDLSAITVMQRIQGYDAEHGDWFWARYTAAGELTDSGQVGMCSRCHAKADGGDYVFLND